MARADSLIFFLTGFAQLIIASEIETALVAAILRGTGSGMLALGVYFLIFVARNHKEFSDRYSKSEKTVSSFWMHQLHLDAFGHFHAFWVVLRVAGYFGYFA